MILLMAMAVRVLCCGMSGRCELVAQSVVSESLPVGDEVHLYVVPATNLLLCSVVGSAP